MKPYFASWMQVAAASTDSHGLIGDMNRHNFAEIHFFLDQARSMTAILLPVVITVLFL